MLTGRKAFLGETVSETLGEILKSEPLWERWPAAVPDSVQHLLGRRLASRMYDCDVRRDRFLMMKLDERQCTSTGLVVVVNWFKELKRLAPHR